jgi:hypothetical protein
VVVVPYHDPDFGNARFNAVRFFFFCGFGAVFLFRGCVPRGGVPLPGFLLRLQFVLLPVRGAFPCVPRLFPCGAAVGSPAVCGSFPCGAAVRSPAVLRVRNARKAASVCGIFTIFAIRSGEIH